MTSLEQLLAPVNVKEFLRDYWNRGPLYIDGADDKFSVLPGVRELPSLLSGRLVGDRWIKGHAHSAQASVIDRMGRVRNVNAVPSMWPELFNIGFSLCFSAVDQYSEQLSNLVQSIRSTTSLPGTILTTSYLTPPCSGSVMHFDSQHAFFMQVSGKKHWRISKRAAWQDAPANIPLSSLNTPAMKAFLDAMGVIVLSPEQIGIQEITLSAGDVLYLPPGVWHEGHTSETHSLHYTLTFMPLGPWQLLVAYLRRAYFAKTSMRRDLRYATAAGDGDSTVLLETALGELREIMASVTAIDLERFFAQMATTDIPIKNHLLLS